MILIGTSGHAKDIDGTFSGFSRIYAHHQQMLDDPDCTCEPYIIGISDPQLRAKIAAEIGYDDLPWHHPNAYVGRECIWGAGTHVQYGVMMTRTWIGHHCTIAPGVTICGDVTIGNRVLIGAGATICEKVVIEDDVIVAAGAVVTPGRWAEDGSMDPHVLKAGRTYMGVPARECSSDRDKAVDVGTDWT